MSRGFVAPALTLALITLCGCQTTRGITTRTQLEAVTSQPITVYSDKDQVYELREHVLVDSVIRGAGTVKQGDRRETFNGSIPLTSIHAVKTDSKNLFKGLALLGVTAVFVAELADGTGHGKGMDVTEDKPIVYPYSGGGGGSSCPYVYAWNGERYVLEAEPFGVGLGKGLELTTVHLLPSARAENGTVRLRLTNERRETHYVNSLRLLAIDLGDAPTAALDGGGTAWPLAHPVAPVAVTDASGRDLLGALRATDGTMWECDSSRLLPGSGYDDVLETAFVRPHGSQAASLVLTGINTTFSTAVYGHLYQAVEDPATLARAVDTDPEMIARLGEYLADASFQASVWNGRAWEPAGAFRPEANAVTFTRALRIHVPDGAGDTVRVRLRSMADVWKLDAIAADWTEASPLPMTPVALSSAVGPDGEDLAPQIGADDDRYAVLLPPDRVELTFAAARSLHGARVVYAVAARGYLHEWGPERTAAGTAPASWSADGRRLDLVKEVLKHREIALRPVYEEWRAVRRAQARSIRQL